MVEREVTVLAAGWNLDDFGADSTTVARFLAIDGGIYQDGIEAFI